MNKKLKTILKLLIFSSIIILLFTSIFYMFDHTHFNGIDEEHESDKFFHRLYFTITTLSSAGYGDITPKTTEIKILSIIIQFILIISLLGGIVNFL